MNSTWEIKPYKQKHVLLYVTDEDLLDEMFSKWVELFFVLTVKKLS